MEADEATGRIRIIKTPEGDPPLRIRQAWVGLVLPCRPAFEWPNGMEQGVIYHHPLRPREPIICVPPHLALDELRRQHRLEAAVWWTERGYITTPTPGMNFFFLKSEVEVVSGVSTDIKQISVANDMETGRMELPGR